MKIIMFNSNSLQELEFTLGNATWLTLAGRGSESPEMRQT